MSTRAFDPAAPERMDAPQPASRELEADLENLRRLNARFGSHRIIRRFLERWLKPGGSYRLLDLCTGGADIPRLAVAWARSRGISLEVVAVDFQPGTLEIARRWCAGYPEITLQTDDARTLQSLENLPAFDFVLCSLALHHFSEADAVQILRRVRALATRGALVADLERTAFAFAAVWLVTAVLYREPMTKFDARLSVRRAFSFGEFAALAARAGWTAFGHARFRFARQAIWLEK
ncbi:MAG: methyltransferase domain-containing protein [Verrucomicrobia bacterium]|nr:methyltransferase domain-containing protein [Verrucomicrobiota bacterium]